MSICCARLFVEPLFKGIKKKDYYEPYKKLGKTLKVSYFNKEVEKCKLTDDIFLKYLMCRPNMRLYIYNSEQPFLTELLDIEYYKHLTLNQKEYKNLILQLKSIKMKFNEIKIENTEIYRLHIYFTESKLETYLDPESDLEYVHGSTTFIETIINAKTLLNSLSIKYLKYMSFDRIIKFADSIKKLNIFLYQTYKNLSLFEMEIVTVTSGTISFSLGIRENTDIDLLVYIMNKKLYREVTNKLTKNLNIRGFDIDVPDGNLILGYYYPNVIVDSIKISTNNTPNDNYDAIYFNPKYYYYFYGLKFANIMTHLYWRFMRNRPAQAAEMLAYHKMLNIPIPLPSIPKYKYITRRYLDNSENVDKFRLIKAKKMISDKSGVKIHSKINEFKVETKENYYVTDLEHEYYKKVTLLFKNFEPDTTRMEIDKEHFVKSVKNYLKKKFKINMSQDEIRHLLTNKGLDTYGDFKTFILKNKNHYI